MALNLKWTRRTFMGSLGAIAGTMLSSKKLFGKVVLAAGKDAPKVSGFGESGNVYEELGVTTVINGQGTMTDRKSTRLNSSHQIISYAVFCFKKKIHIRPPQQSRTPIHTPF